MVSLHFPSCLVSARPLSISISVSFISTLFVVKGETQCPAYWISMVSIY